MKKNLLKTCVVMALALGAYVTGTGHSNAQTELRIGTDGAAPPWTFTDASGELKGYDIDVGNEICRRLNYKCVWVINEWKGIFPALQAGKFDMIMAGMVATPERRKAMDFSRSYAVRQSMFAVKAGSPLAGYEPSVEVINFDRLDDGAKAELDRLRQAFQGKTVGHQSGDVFGSMINEQFADTMDTREYDKLESRDLDLQAERIDLAVNSTSYWKKVEKKGSIDLALIGPKMGGGSLGGGIVAAISKGNDQLRGEVDEAINALLADGSLRDLTVKWLGSDASPGS